MPKMVITLEDGSDDNVNISVDFGDNGLQQDSGAHYYGYLAFSALKDAMEREEAEEPSVEYLH